MGGRRLLRALSLWLSPHRPANSRCSFPSRFLLSPSPPPSRASRRCRLSARCRQHLPPRPQGRRRDAAVGTVGGGLRPRRSARCCHLLRPAGERIGTALGRRGSALQPPPSLPRNTSVLPASASGAARPAGPRARWEAAPVPRGLWGRRGRLGLQTAAGRDPLASPRAVLGTRGVVSDLPERIGKLTAEIRRLEDPGTAASPPRCHLQRFSWFSSTSRS